MQISVGEPWESFVEAAVKDGRYESASDVVREALRLLEAREKKFRALRQTIQDAIAEGGEASEDEIDAAVSARLDAWTKKPGSAA